MTVVKIDNGFVNNKGKGILLAGKLLSGYANAGHKLIVNENQKIPILAVEYPKGPSLDTIYIVLTVPRETDVVWPDFYRKELKIEV